MDQRTEKALATRRLVVQAVVRAFHSHRELTKKELVDACQVVKLDAAWFSKLIQAEVIKSKRGRNATYTLASSYVNILMNMETYIKRMHNHQVEACNERRRQARITDYKREIKRLKMILDSHGIAY